jgi:ribosome-associated protein
MKKKIRIKDEFIKLGQALKLSGEADTGVDAKYIIEEGKVKVNGEVEIRRGRKLYNGDVFSVNDSEVTVVSASVEEA